MFVCQVCTYPARNAACCDNPGCEANPSVGQAQKDAWRAERDKRAAEEAEREWLRQLRRRTRF
jgi:hypothetical protein